MVRKLTTKFGSRKISQYEKKTGKSINDLLEMHDLKITNLITLIKIGSPEIDWNDDNTPYDRYDEYMAESPNNNLMTAFMEIMESLDRDMHWFFGVDIGKIRKQMDEKIADLNKKLNENLESNEDENKDNVIENDTPVAESE